MRKITTSEIANILDLSPYLYDDGLPSCWWTPTGDKTVHNADKSGHYSEISHFS